MAKYEQKPGDSALIDKIVLEVKSQGAFDQFRRECMADVDTKPAYQNLRQRVEGSVASFLGGQQWRPDLNKNQLRDKLRRHITETGFLETGVERIVDQVVNPKINTVFLSTIEDISYKYLGIDKPKPSLADCFAAVQAAQPPPTPLQPPAPLPQPPPPPPPPPASSPPTLDVAMGSSNGNNRSPANASSSNNNNTASNGPLIVNILPPGTEHTFDTTDLDLEAVSPDSDKTSNDGNGSSNSNDQNVASPTTMTPSVGAASASAAAAVVDPHDTSVDSISNDDNLNATGQTDDFESPAFEPLEGRTSSAMSERIDKRNANDDDIETHNNREANGDEKCDADGDNSKLSAISGLTSRDSMESENRSPSNRKDESFSSQSPANVTVAIPSEAKVSTVAHNAVSLPDAATTTDAANNSNDPPLDHSSELSQVSSNSRLSIVTTGDPQSPPPAGGQLYDQCDDAAQMPRFSDNSNNSHNANAATATDANASPALIGSPLSSTLSPKTTTPPLPQTTTTKTSAIVLASAGTMPAKATRPLQTTFADINHDEILFEGTRRHSICSDIKAEAAAAAAASAHPSSLPLSTTLPPPLLAAAAATAAGSDALQPLLPVAPPPVPSQMVPVVLLGGGGAVNGSTSDGKPSAGRSPRNQSQASSMSLSSCTSSVSSLSSSNLVIAETKSTTLNGEDDDDVDVDDDNVVNATAATNEITQMGMLLDEANDATKKETASSTATVSIGGDVVDMETKGKIVDDFQFEAPTIDASESREKPRDASASKPSSSSSSSTRHRSSGHGHSSSSSSRKHSSSSTAASSDKDKHKDGRHRSSTSSSARHGSHSGSRSKDKRGSSSTKEAKDKDPKESSSHRTVSSKSTSGRSSSSSSSKHHRPSSSSGSGSSHHRQHSSSASKSKERSHPADVTKTLDDKNNDGGVDGDGDATHSPRKAAIDDASEPCRKRTIERNRSTDQDSNDEQSATPPASISNATAVTTTTSTTTSTTATDPPTNDKQEPTMTAAAATDSCDDYGDNGDDGNDDDNNDFILSDGPQPVVVDQILTGAQLSDHDLERLIALSDDPVLRAIQETIASSTSSAVKRPKMASNVFEARKLMKVRKQMERDDKKRIELAMVQAKQYLSANVAAAQRLGLSVRRGQGVELEFACVTRAPNAAPSISSPIKSADVMGRKQNDVDDGDDDDVNFNGFNASMAPRQILSSEDVLDNGDAISDDDEFCGFGSSDLQHSVNRTTLARCITELAAGKAQASKLMPAINSAKNSRAQLARRPKSRSESNVTKSSLSIGLRKRTTPDKDEDDAAVVAGYRPRRFKIDARIQMVAGTVREAGNSSSSSPAELDDVEMLTDSDDVRSMTSSSGGSLVAMGASQVSPTPSDQSVSSKENNFVPKIKKAVSRSLAHNTAQQQQQAAAAAALATTAASATSSTTHAPVLPNVPSDQQQPLTAFQKKNVTSVKTNSQQRYTSDDLYKPRPILSGSRSRRRAGGFDNGDL